MKNYLPVSIMAIILVLAAGIFSFMVVPGGDNQISGMTTSQVYIIQTPPENCSVNLTSGINMVSFYCETGTSPISTALENRTHNVLNYSAIYKYNANNINDSWDSYNPNLPSWTVQALTNLNRRYGYVVVMNSDGEYFEEGYAFVSTNITLRPGWNFIGYPSNSEMNISNALSQIDGIYTRAEAYTNVNETKTWLFYVPESGGTLQFMTPMVGYWVHVNQSSSLLVNW